MFPVSALLAALLPTVLALGPITSKGSKFFNPDGSQFYIKGVAYQLTDADPLADADQCKLDAALMQTLGANTIRVYHVDASADHDSCMSTFADAGIYTLIDLDTFSTYIYNPPAAPTWNNAQYSAFQAVMDTFQGYDNVLGFFVANELLNTGSDSVAAPYIKAAARDMKAYRDQRGYREIPVGYSAADVAILRPNLQNYLACGGNASEAVDFYSLNTYEWCGDSSYTVSGYDILQNFTAGYPIPIFFSEDGCNTPEPRTFTDQTAILGPEMVDTWSGAIIYEWIQFVNNYGLVSYGDPVAATATGSNINQGFVVAGTPTPIAPDFTDLSSQWATLTPTGVSSAAYTPSGTTPTCPAYTAGTWEISGDVPLPTLGESFSKASKVAQTATVSSASGSAASTSGAAAASSSSASASDSESSKKSAAAPFPAPEFGSLGISLAVALALASLGFAVAL